MNTPPPMSRPHPRAGISLLEVLISIGILSIGLLATLSLIPAGRTYMKKAAVDDRAAALVPNAYATMTRLGLMNQSALSWTDVPDADFTDSSETSVVIRDARGGDIFNYSPMGHTYNPSAPESSAPWVITATNTVYAVTHYAQPVYSLDGGATFQSLPSPDYIRGTTGTSASGFTVTLTTTGSHSSGPGTPSAGPTGSTVSNPTTGAWSYAVSPQPLFVPLMDIETSGPNLGNPKAGTYYYVDYSTTAVYTAPGSPPVSTSANPNPSAWRQYGRLRQYDDRRGRARITYSRPATATDGNHDPDSALLVPVTRLENATTQGQGTIARSVTRKIKGTLWRLQAGTREGNFTRRIHFGPNGTTITSIDPAVFPDADITENAGDTWVAGPVNHEDVDWYKFRVDAGDMLQISWNDPNGVLAADSGYKFPLYLNTTSTSGGPMPSIAAFNTATSRTYTIPNDGYVITRAKLLPYNPANPDADIPGLVNTFPTKDWPKNSRVNPPYDFTVTFTRTDRVVVVDPLMASRFDKVLSLSGPVGDFDPRYLKRHRFADFQQTYAQTGSPRAFVIPRLNWQMYSSGFVDTMVAVSEKLFHDQDNIAVDLPTNSEDPPTQIFDLASTNSPGRRQAEGRMSWLLMVQPEDPGPVATNWVAGRYFDVSLVIFENRKLPPLVANPPLDGEYAFNASWNDLDGMITVTVPAALGLDEDDVRDLFKTGAWVLLAPQINYDASPLDSTQRLDWIRIQTAQVEPGANGVVTAKILPESEPADNILYRTSYPLNTTSFPIVVLAYQGVVAVVNKSVQLAP
jgi:Tfp pilus assembly protein PilV